MTEDESQIKRRVIDELRDLALHGNSDDVLARCEHLSRYLSRDALILPLAEWRQPTTLRKFFEFLAAKERSLHTDGPSEVLAALEFIGLEDETQPDPPISPSERGAPDTAYRRQIRRGAVHLPPLRGKPLRHSVTRQFVLTGR